jgi:predicted DsbA family dithiol-disulfide isomerase
MKTAVAYLFLALLSINASWAQQLKVKNKHHKKIKNMNSPAQKMSIEVWSDVMCPFCYIGKRKFEQALEQFPDKNHVQLIWKSFQLSPDMKTDLTQSTHQYLAKHKGISVAEAKQMGDYVTQVAAQVGLKFDFDKAVVANSFRAHQFTHFAKKYGKQNEAEELLFRSYFTDGKNIDDLATLLELGAAIGLNTETLETALANGTYAAAVKADIAESQQIGVRGVPFFVFNRKYAVSGAQESQVFLQTLEKSFGEWRKQNPAPTLEVIEGQVCTPDGVCK